MENSKISFVAKTLNISELEAKQFSKVKTAYRSLMIKNAAIRSKRIQLNRAYQTSFTYLSNISENELVTAIMQANIPILQKKISQDKSLLNKQIGPYPPIYLAVRSGHYEVVEFIIKAGCKMDFVGARSTPMHCAAYYGHYGLIPLLLRYGVPTDIKNIYEHIPQEEAATDAIIDLLKGAKINKINILQEKILKQKIGYSTINIVDPKDSQIVFKKIILKNYFRQLNNHQDAFHGTSYDSLMSIAIHGLKKPGDKVEGKTLSIVQGHIPLGTKFQGKQDWPRAIFVSPSIYYAANPVYSKQIIVMNETWLPLVQVKVKKGSYTSHDHTLKLYNKAVNQPNNLQYRVECKNDDRKDLICRVENEQNAIVVALVFIKKGYLESHPDYQKVTDLLLNSAEEQMFKKFAV